MIDDTTPGSAVADTLQTILARKRADSRQQMIDDINRRNMESEMSFRAEQAASSKEQREAHAQDFQAIAADRAAKTAALAAKQKSRSEMFDENNPNSILWQLPWEAQQNLRTQYQLDPESVDELLKTMVSKQMDAEKNAMVPMFEMNRLDGSMRPAIDPITHKPMLGKPGERPFEYGEQPAPGVMMPGWATDPNNPDDEGHEATVSVDPRARGIVQYPKGFTPYGGKLGTERDHKAGSDLPYDQKVADGYAAAVRLNNPQQIAIKAGEFMNTIHDPVINKTVTAVNHMAPKNLPWSQIAKTIAPPGSKVTPDQLERVRKSIAILRPDIVMDQQ